jgi:hypothetical protein
MNAPNGVCRSGKTAYPDEQTAKVALVEIRAMNVLHNTRRKTPCRVYLCEQWCGLWHLTSKPDRRRKAA